MAHESESNSYAITVRVGGKYHKPHEAPMPGREELLARNSFGSPDNNKYLNAPRKAEIAQKELELAQLKRGTK